MTSLMVCSRGPRGTLRAPAMATCSSDGGRCRTSPSSARQAGSCSTPGCPRMSVPTGPTGCPGIRPRASESRSGHTARTPTARFLDTEIQCYGDINMPMKPGTTKNLLLRLEPGLAERLQTVADVEGRSVSDVVREAIANLVQERRNDKRFLRLLDDSLARHEQAISLLRDEAS